MNTQMVYSPTAILKLMVRVSQDLPAALLKLASMPHPYSLQLCSYSQWVRIIHTGGTPLNHLALVTRRLVFQSSTGRKNQKDSSWQATTSR